MRLKDRSMHLAWAIFAMSILAACSSPPVPKPRGYFRIDLPERSYKTYQSDCPFTFEYPSYATVIVDTIRFKEPCWLNLHFPNFRGDLHVSYKQVNNNLEGYLEDSYQFAMKHMSMASAMNDSTVFDADNRVFGLVYKIEGEHTASPYQFYLTDSTHHFFRGALYFNVRPNNDSLAPVIRFIEKDMEHLIETFRWKQQQ
ncbi:MAG: gliding motility lipoprotein GldD [Flavobacteriales bacterium]|nr:gliding motility lipoprotein GldD [Flavobacteriales bacterium]